MNVKFYISSQRQFNYKVLATDDGSVLFYTLNELSLNYVYYR